MTAFGEYQQHPAYAGRRIFLRQMWQQRPARRGGAMAETTSQERPAGVEIGWARLGIGLAQGLALYGLSFADKHKAWPATDKPLMAGLELALAFSPLGLLAGIGHLRRCGPGVHWFHSDSRIEQSLGGIAGLCSARCGGKSAGRAGPSALYLCLPFPSPIT